MGGLLHLVERGGDWAGFMIFDVAHLHSKGLMQFSYVYQISFLPRDAMHKRGLCRHAVSVRPSVRPSVRHVRTFCQNE